MCNSSLLTFAGSLLATYCTVVAFRYNNACMYVLLFIGVVMMILGNLLSEIEHERELNSIRTELMRKGVYLNDKN